MTNLSRSSSGCQLKKGDAWKLRQQLSAFEDWQLCKVYEYFQDDLIYIVGSLNTNQLLAELQLQTTQKWEHYVKMKDEIEASEFSVKLVQDVLHAGREAILSFWECLHILCTDSSPPNLCSVLDEILKTGENLVQQILLDELGHSLTFEVKDIQKCHKQHLLTKTWNLVEKQPPGTTLEQQSFCISERFVNLVVVSGNQFRQQSKNELIDTGIKHEICLLAASSQLEHISSGRLFRWCNRSACVPRMIMVSGVPGVGKTTLMQKFVYDWVMGKHYQRFSFIFFFKFRELNQITEVSLEKLILQEYPHLQPELDKILLEPENVLFIFDGLDESVHQTDFRSTMLCSDIKHAKGLGVIVVSLVRQSLLKGCSVLMTSRPTKLASIDLEAFQRVSEIMGFFSRERQMYFECFCTNKELSNKMFQYVKENDSLYTFCYIPSYCWIICTVLSACFKGKSTADGQIVSSMPKTVTQLFVTYIANILFNHCQDSSGARELLSSIGRMAEYGVMNHTVIFDKKHLNSFSVDIQSPLFSSFMTEAGQSPEVTFSFLHLTIQEFFAALIHYIDYSPEKLQTSLREAKSFEDNRAELFLRFLCGLSDASTGSLLKPYLKELSLETPKVIINWLQNSICDAWKLDEYKDDNKQLITVFEYLFETRNKVLVLKSLGSNQSLDFSYVPLTPLDCSVFPFILESCKETKRLNLESCRIQKEGLGRLVSALHTVEDLSLRDNNLKDDGIKIVCAALKHPNCKIQKLCLSSNGLTQNALDHLAPTICINQSLKLLDLSYNNMDGPQLSDLMTALSSASCRIEELLLNRANLTHTSCSQLASAIKSSQSLRKLDLTDNRLEGPHFSDLTTALSSPTCRIEELVLSCDGRKLDSSSIQLDSTISANQSLRSLNLSGSCLIGPLFTNLMDALSSPSCKLQEIILKDSGLTDGSSSQLASAISQNQSLRKLDLSFNHLVGPHFKDLLTALSSPTCRIQELQLEKVGMTDEHAPLLLSLRTNQSLSVLDVRRNFSGNSALGSITDQLLESLEVLRLQNCDRRLDEDSGCEPGRWEDRGRRLSRSLPGLKKKTCSSKRVAALLCHITSYIRRFALPHHIVYTSVPSPSTGFIP
ncbi:PREDICTED: NACHT, LRR and PYD domains-containing protein 12-like [Nanorana parkeri]|uniref:NACHT, LRR and PYD domains-containing protein 12-like n=1 Tax=Nanorana parkeri TaxID=125878 RepID=UPI000854AE0C|nr:PREDICTED: NACHT, LRR and PYD domains-containing protein 12-like [Nanorana parkeri]